MMAHEVESVRNREERFNRLHEAHFEAVRRYVWRRDPDLADDVVADTFLVAWRRLDDVPADARPWLIGVARNIRLNSRRSARRQQAVATRLQEEVPQAPASDSSHLAAAVDASLMLLSPSDREVLLLSIWDDLDRAAIAEVLGCTKANVSLRLHRARRRFADALAGVGADAGRPECTPLIPGGASDAH